MADELRWSIGPARERFSPALREFSAPRSSRLARSTVLGSNSRGIAFLPAVASCRPCAGASFFFAAAFFFLAAAARVLPITSSSSLSSSPSSSAAAKLLALSSPTLASMTRGTRAPEFASLTGGVWSSEAAAGGVCEASGGFVSGFPGELDAGGLSGTSASASCVSRASFRRMIIPRMSASSSRRASVDGVFGAEAAAGSAGEPVAAAASKPRKSDHRAWSPPSRCPSLDAASFSYRATTSFSTVGRKGLEQSSLAFSAARMASWTFPWSLRTSARR
mmetsp:Transcript_12541/g.36349  ORF Transcript_12541/g.36349 Transcript_12541/m.36349 type:complete len:277 (-) Transcript_12541:1408-2238(-)